MSLQEPIALATDALRGHVQALLSPARTVVGGAPSPAEPGAPGVFVLPLRIAVSSAVRNRIPARNADGTRAHPALDLELDYLIAGLGGEGLAELAMLDAVVRWLYASPMSVHKAPGEDSPGSERRTDAASDTLTVRWGLLDVPLEQTAQIWSASGMPQRAGIFVRANLSWQPRQAPAGPVVDR